MVYLAGWICGLSWFALVDLSSPECMGQTESPEETSGQPENVAKAIQPLMEALEHGGFEKRERAAASIMRLGPAAIGPLQEMIGPDHSREVRDRSAVILKEIEQRLLQETSQAFLSDPDPTQSHGLPAWRYFEQQLGGTRVSKLLYLELLKSQFRLAELIESVDRATADPESEAVDRLQRDLRDAMRDEAVTLWPLIFRGSGVGIGDSAAMMLGVMILDRPIPMEVSQIIHSSVQLGFFGYINRGGYRNALKHLLAGWIPKAHEAMAPEVMRIAFDMDIDAILPIARKHLSKSFDKTTREHAIFCMAKFGSASDVSDLLLLHDDTTIVYEFDDTSGGITVSRVPPPGLPGDTVFQYPHKLVRVNDLAIAAAMILLNEDPKTIFPRFSEELFFNRSLTSLAVDEENADLRTAQLKAWAAERLNNSYDG